MATKVWSGTDGNWGTAGNWSPSGVPVNGDDVIFNTGSQAVTGSDQSAVTLDSLTVTDDYTGDIGSSSTSMSINATEVRLSGGGNIYLNGTYTDMHVLNQPATGDGCDLDGSITNLYWSAGNMTLASTLSVTTAYFVASVGTCTIETSVSITAAFMTGGTVSASSAPTTFALSSGTWTQLDGASTTFTQTGGVYNFQTDDTITTARVFAGTFDARENTNFGATITTMIIGKATVRLDGGVEITLTNSPILLNGKSSKLVRNPGEAA